jgi:hypothetical protein
MVCAPAATVEPTVRVTVAFVPGAIEVGEIEADTPDALFAISAIALFPLPLSVTLTVNVVEPPVCAEPELADTLSAKSTLVADSELPHSLTSNAPSTDPSPVARL